MTVSSEQSDVTYDGDGVTLTFPVPFYFLQDTDLVLTVVDQDGTAESLVYGTDYSVAGAGNQFGGSVTLSAVVAETKTLLIERDPPATQETAYQANDPFPAKEHEKALDKLTMLLQRGNRTYSRSLHYPITENADGTLPRKSERLGMLLGFDPITGLAKMMPRPASVGAGDLRVDTFISSALPNPDGLPTFAPNVSTQLTLSRDPGTTANVAIYFDTGFQGPDTFGLNGPVVTFNAPIPDVQRVYARTGTTLSTIIPPDSSVGDKQLQWSDKLSRECASVAELRTLSTGRYRVAHTLSYYGDGKGGAGKYRIDELDTTTPDNGGTVIVGNDGGRWKLIYDGSVNFLQFGCRTEGVETGARLQAALSSGVKSLVATAMHDTATPLIPPTSYLDIITQKGGGFRPAADNVTIFKSTVSAYYVRFIGPVFEGNDKTGCACMDMKNMRLFSGLLYPTFRNIDTGFIGRDGCFGLHIVNPTAEAVPFPIIFIANNSSTVVECPNFDNGAGVGGTGLGTGITVQATGSNLGVVVNGGYIQGYDHAVFDNGIGTTVRDMYIENCGVADVKSTSGRSCRYENLNHWGNVGPLAYQLDGTDGCVVWNPTMGSGARTTGLFDVDTSNTNFSYFLATATAGLNQPLGTVVGAKFGPRSSFAMNPVPFVAGGTSAGAGVYTRQEGRVSIQAGQVDLELEIGCTSHTGTGAFVIKGLSAGLAPVSYVPTRIGQVVVISAAYAGKQLYAKLNGAGTDISVIQVDPATGIETPFPVPAGGFTVILRMSWNTNA